MDTPPPEEKVKELVYDPDKASHNENETDGRLSEERPSKLVYDPEKISHTDNDVDGRFSEEHPSTSRSEDTASQASSETEYATPVVEAAPLTVIVEEKTIEVTEEQSRSPSIIEETLPYSEHELGEEKKEDANSTSSLSEEEIMVVSPHAQSKCLLSFFGKSFFFQNKRRRKIYSGSLCAEILLSNGNFVLMVDYRAVRENTLSRFLSLF
ncbi:unnamed protein product [Cylicostephanus goldi]|uniref:Uncharacterized protein n=1 Tax=Cylicostephanus goldi TaxID=71465 RepID=A0A3P6RQZ5_CYLGO|nr:unnamed protein product [Cylicostephanus goldi]